MENRESQEESRQQKGNGAEESMVSTLLDRGSGAYAQTEQAVTQAYDRTARAVRSSYDQAIKYGRQNPARMAAAAFGIGVGLGLLWGALPRRSRSGRIVQPVVNAFYDIAREVLR